MESIITAILAFLVMLNPFALFIYLTPVMDELSKKDFRKVLLKATTISFGIFFLFLLAGDFIIQKIFIINFESFRIFGGIVIFSFAYFYIVKGQKALVHMKEDLDDLASEIALPFMVGAGTISLAIIIGNEFRLLMGSLSLIVVLVITSLLILALQSIKGGISKKKFKVAFDKVMEISLRLFGFFIGAIGINMIITGINNLFF